MSRLDLIIFGATGFTGKHAVQEMVQMAKKYPGLTWGIAGRSQKKLDELIADVSKKTGEDLSCLKTFIADVQDEKSLKEMCCNAQVLVNCCGPYRLYGEPVVRAAIDSKTNYVDVSGEPQFMESMQLNYDQQAREAGVYIISACGFDSIPADMGVVFLEKNFGGTLNSVECYLSAQAPAELWAETVRCGAIHYGTWESLVYGISHKNELPALRKKLFPERLPTFKPKLQPRSAIHKHEDGWCIPFPGADASIVYRTQRHLYENDHKRPVHFRPYVKMSFFSMLATIVAGMVLFVMTKTNFTMGLLLKYPRFFSMGFVSHDGPTEAVMNSTKFEFELLGEGWEAGCDVETTPPNKKMTAKVSGVNPGYGATVVALLLSAATVLYEAANMPSTGGVMTTGVAFRSTTLTDRLTENNLKFELVHPDQSQSVSAAELR